MENIYLTPEKEAFAEIIEKKSRFIGSICHIDNEDDALSYIKSIKKRNFNANHNVFAYITSNTKRYSDDGEPSKTAGLPILNMLENQNITDVVCVVTRYFGGTLLGTGGLVRAYTSTAKLALENAGIKKMHLYDKYEFIVPYQLFDNVKYISAECKCIFLQCDYTDKIKIEAVCLKKDSENLLNKLNSTFGINIIIKHTEEIFR